MTNLNDKVCVSILMKAQNFQERIIGYQIDKLLFVCLIKIIKNKLFVSLCPLTIKSYGHTHRRKTGTAFKNEKQSG